MKIKVVSRGQPRGQVVKFTCSASAAQGFAGSDLGRQHGTAHQAMLRRHPTCHKQRHSQLEYTTMYWGALGRRRRRNKETKDWQQMLAQVPIFKRKKKNHLGSFRNLHTSNMVSDAAKGSLCIWVDTP